MQQIINWQRALKVHFIAGTQDVADGKLFPLLESAIKSGITCFQLREKGQGSLKERPNGSQKISQSVSTTL